MRGGDDFGQYGIHIALTRATVGVIVVCEEGDLAKAAGRA
jgi:hypothetical protein